jgi:hypothetical protein
LMPDAGYRHPTRGGTTDEQDRHSEQDNPGQQTQGQVEGETPPPASGQPPAVQADRFTAIGGQFVTINRVPGLASPITFNAGAVMTIVAPAAAVAGYMEAGVAPVVTATVPTVTAAMVPSAFRSCERFAT